MLKQFTPRPIEAVLDQAFPRYPAYSSVIDMFKAFKRWVTRELLPQLRRAGYYGTLDLKERIALGNQMLGIVDRLVKSGGDSFVRRALMDRLREVCLLLGQSTPDVALLGKDATQMALPTV